MAQMPDHHIVVGFGGSSDRVAALTWALAEARLCDTSVTEYHAWHWPYSPDAAAETQRVVAAAGRQVLDQGGHHAERHAADVDLTCELTSSTRAPDTR